MLSSTEFVKNFFNAAGRIATDFSNGFLSFEFKTWIPDVASNYSEVEVSEHSCNFTNRIRIGRLEFFCETKLFCYHNKVNISSNCQEMHLVHQSHGNWKFSMQLMA